MAPSATPPIRPPTNWPKAVPRLWRRSPPLWMKLLAPVSCSRAPRAAMIAPISITNAVSCKAPTIAPGIMLLMAFITTTKPATPAKTLVPIPNASPVSVQEDAAFAISSNNVCMKLLITGISSGILSATAFSIPIRKSMKKPAI